MFYIGNHKSYQAPVRILDSISYSRDPSFSICESEFVNSQSSAQLRSP